MNTGKFFASRLQKTIMGRHTISKIKVVILLVILLIASMSVIIAFSAISTKSNNALVIDEPFWPGSLNQFTNPYPNWLMYTVYQTTFNSKW
jgi:hypothetical protein